MAKYFGMKLYYWRDGQMLKTPLPLWQFARRIEFGDGSEKYIVGDESVTSLAARLGDTVLTSGCVEVCSLTPNEDDLAQIEKIIQRNGQTFIWPESEKV